MTTDNSDGCANNRTKTRRSKAMDMRFYWVRHQPSHSSPLIQTLTERQLEEPLGERFEFLPPTAMGTSNFAIDSHHHRTD
jgi:hypothetical protein